MKKEKIKNIVLIIVVAVISSTITSFATSNYLFDSIDVKYDNSNGVQAETVQGAIDELYSCASDYSSVNNKIDGYFKNNPTSYFDGNTLMLGKTNTVGNTALQFFNDGIMNGHIYTRKSDHAMVVTSDNNKPLLLSGRPINLLSDQVQIDGVDITGLASNSLTSPTPANGVTIYNGGYHVIGKLVFVNIKLSVDTSVVNLYGGVNNRATLLSGFPLSYSNTELYCSYPDPTARYMVTSTNPIDTNGNISVTFDSNNPYSAGWTMTITGVYLAS